MAAPLKDAGFSLRANRKTREGTSDLDRDAQFRYRNACVRRALQQPTISVVTKKRKLVLDFKNGGRTARVHDFVDETLGQRRLRVYDLLNDPGWVRTQRLPITPAVSRNVATRSPHATAESEPAPALAGEPDIDISAGGRVTARSPNPRRIRLGITHGL